MRYRPRLQVTACHLSLATVEFGGVVRGPQGFRSVGLWNITKQSCDRNGVIAEHVRCINGSHDRGETIYDWRHIWRSCSANSVHCATAHRSLSSPRALAVASNPLEAPGRRSGDGRMVEILALVLLHDEQAVLTAVELALQANSSELPEPTA
jgi:hypothetical protein